MRRKRTNKVDMETTVKITDSEKKITYTRFDISQRTEHIIFLLSFTILGFTGLIQKFSANQVSDAFIYILGGIEQVRIIHHYSAIVMMIVSGYHVLVLAYKVFVLRVRWSILPVIEDIQHLIQDIAYFLGLRKNRAYYGRYNYAEKVEYLAVVWGTIIMGLTGFMMWNPLSTTRLLPGDFIPAAKAAHGAEAILAVLAIIVWHFYHVHIKHFNKSMFTGKLTRTEMMHEHPAELSQIEAGQLENQPPVKVIRHRQQVFFPAALVFTVAFSFGIYKFTNFEVTAITTVPQGETALVYVPVTPTPRPSPTPPPTLDPNAEVGAMTWDGYFSGLFRNRCSTCHGITRVGGLSLSTYQDALKGGNSGPAIIPGDPDHSVLVQMQSSGNHPGQLTIDELNQVIAWILAGAPEK
jgi:cytochrome b subunit of formate dehydrogenase